MFSLKRLEEIKWEVEKHLRHPNALSEMSMLKDDTYQIIKLEEITDRAFVYKAIEVSSGTCVSIKEFFPKTALGLQDQLYFERDLETNAVLLKDSTEFKTKQFKNLIDGFIEEAKYLEKISYGDPIFRILDSFRDYNTAYIVTNYNKWPSLQDFFDVHHQFTEDELDWLMSSLLDTVTRFHRRSIVHRNVNSRNIYIKPDELVLDSLGTCDFLQDIKIYDADAYHNKYYAPEVMMHNGVIGTWTDVYAIGKVMIDIISNMCKECDYFEGLKNIKNPEVREAYAKSVKMAIAFNHDERLTTAMSLRKSIYGDRDDEKVYKTPRSMIAAVAAISFISCMLVLWQYNNDTLLADNQIIQQGSYISAEDLEEETPAGSFTELNDFYFISSDKVTFQQGSEMIIKWFFSGRCELINLEIKSQEKTLFDRPLEWDQNNFDLSELNLKNGSYLAKLYYKVGIEIFSDSIEFKIEE